MTIYNSITYIIGRAIAVLLSVFRKTVLSKELHKFFGSFFAPKRERNLQYIIQLVTQRFGL